MKSYFLDNKDNLKPKMFISYGTNIYNDKNLSLKIRIWAI